MYLKWTDDSLSFQSLLLLYVLIKLEKYTHTVKNIFESIHLVHFNVVNLVTLFQEVLFPKPLTHHLVHPDYAPDSLVSLLINII